MKLTKTKLKKIIKEELKEMGDPSQEEVVSGAAPRTGGWDERDDIQTFFDRLEFIVYMSAQWQTVEEAQQVIQEMGEEAARVRP